MNQPDPALVAQTAELMARFARADRSWMTGEAARQRDRSRSVNRACTSRWIAQNPEAVTLNRQRRYRRNKAACPPDYDHEKVRVIYEWAERLTRCTGITFHVDHVFPLAKGGEHSHRNMQPLPDVLNTRKSARTMRILPHCWRQPEDGYRAQPLAMNQEV